MTTKQVTIIRKSRHIEWDVNLGIVGAKRLTSPLFADCIEMRRRNFMNNILYMTYFSASHLDTPRKSYAGKARHSM